MKLRLIEGSVEGDYNKFYSAIDRDTFNELVKLDPKTAIKNDEIINIGFGAKQLILPKWLAGDHDILNKAEDVKKAFETFYANMKSYPAEFKNLASYKSVDDFIKFTKGESVEAEVAVKENPIDTIYNKYYSKLDRKEFDRLIALDSETNDAKIGEVVKNLVLPKVIAGEKIDDYSKLKDAITIYHDDFSSLSKENQNLNSYNTINSFVSKMLTGAESDLVARLKNDTTVDEKTHRTVAEDAVIVGSTSNYDIIWEKSYRAANAVGGGWRNPAGMHWCTGWEPDDNGTPNDRYFNTYGSTENGKALVAFIKKGADRGSSNRPTNWQISMDIKSGEITDFLDGTDGTPTFKGNTTTERFKSFLLAYPDIAKAIEGKEPFKNCRAVKEVLTIINLANANSELNINTTEDVLLAKYFMSEGCPIRVISIGIEDIPPLLFEGQSSLEKVTFKDTVKTIGAGAFINCTSLKSLTLPKTLEVIGKNAFQGCSSMTGSVRIPDTLTEIRTNAFLGTHVKLSVNKERKTKLKISNVDADWFKSHSKGILIR